MSENKVACMRCGSTDWTVSMITDCDQCNPDLSIDRLEKQMNCPHEHTEPSRIIGLSKCLDCGMVGTEIFAKEKK